MGIFSEGQFKKMLEKAGGRPWIRSAEKKVLHEKHLDKLLYKKNIKDWEAKKALKTLRHEGAISSFGYGKAKKEMHDISTEVKKEKWEEEHLKPEEKPEHETKQELTHARLEEIRKGREETREKETSATPRSLPPTPPSPPKPASSKPSKPPGDIPF